MAPEEGRMNRGQFWLRDEQVSKIEPVLAADTRGEASGSTINSSSSASPKFLRSAELGHDAVLLARVGRLGLRIPRLRYNPMGAVVLQLPVVEGKNHRIFSIY